MSFPTMKAFKWAYKTNPATGVVYYDLLNEYETDPLEVIKSKLILRLGTIKGEWGPDPDFGIPLGAIKQNTSNPDVIAQLISDEILKVTNVSGVRLVSSSLESTTRLYTASFAVNTIYGETSIEVAI